PRKGGGPRQPRVAGALSWRRAAGGVRRHSVHSTGSSGARPRIQRAATARRDGVPFGPGAPRGRAGAPSHRRRAPERDRPALHPGRHARRRLPGADRADPDAGGGGMRASSSWLNPFWQIFQMRIRGFAREPAATFWVFVFPLLMSVALGLAFRNQGAARLSVAVADGPGKAEILAPLGGRR